MFGILEYSELFHNCIPTAIQNRVIFTKIGKSWGNPGNLEHWHFENPVKFRTLTYWRLKKFKMDRFNYFSKALLDLWQGSEYTHLWISTILSALPIVVNSDLFRHIGVLFRHIESHRGIFRTPYDSFIFRSLH